MSGHLKGDNIYSFDMQESFNRMIGQLFFRQCDRSFNDSEREHLPWLQRSTCQCGPAVSSYTLAADARACPPESPADRTSLGMEGGVRTRVIKQNRQKNNNNKNNNTATNDY